MDTETFTDEEVRVLKELAAGGEFHGTDYATVKHLVLQGYVAAKDDTLTITRRGRLALRGLDKPPDSA